MTRRTSERGQAAAEFLIIAPLLLFFCLCILQMVLMYQAKATLDYATLQAAREGAVTSGAMAEMQRGLARGLAPLYARNADADGARLAEARAAADVPARSEIAILNPTPAMLAEFGRRAQRDSSGAREIPNDTLMYRSAVTGTSGVNIQDANLLKIRARYCYEMYVPLAGKVIYYIANVIGNVGRSGILTREPAEDDRYGAPRNPTPCVVTLRDGMSTGRWPIAMESEAVVRMQSPFRASSATVTPR